MYEEFGWKLCGAWETAMVNESECFLHWAIPTWESWAETEKAERMDSALQRWRKRTYELSEKWHRFLVVDAPLSPMRIGRQPARPTATRAGPTSKRLSTRAAPHRAPVA